MGSEEVVVVHPGLEVGVAFVGVGPVFCVSPFAQSGLDEAFGLAVGAGCVGTSEAVTDIELGAGLAEVAGAIAGAIVGEQGANLDAVQGVESQGIVQEGAGGLGCKLGRKSWVKPRREWSSMATCRATEPACWGRPRRRPSARRETC